MDAQGDVAMTNASLRPMPGTPQQLSHLASAHPYAASGGHPQAARIQQLPQGQSVYATPQGQTPQHLSQASMHAQTHPVSHPSAYNAALAGQAFTPRGIHPNTAAAQSYPSAPSPVFPMTRLPGRHPEVYVMSDAANAEIPASIRAQYPCDDKGRVLWFTSPPILTHSTEPKSNDTLHANATSNGSPLPTSPGIHIDTSIEVPEERKPQTATSDIQERRAAYIAARDLRRAKKAARDALQQKPVTQPEPQIPIDPLIQQTLTLLHGMANDAYVPDEEAVRWAEYDALRAKEAMEKAQETKKYFEGLETEYAEKKKREERAPVRFLDDYDPRY